MAAVSPQAATTYFIDYSSGSEGFSQRRSTSTPWKHTPGDANATGTSAATSILGGDVLEFKGGVTYLVTNSPIYLTNGTAGSPVTYDGNSAGS